MAQAGLIEAESYACNTWASGQGDTIELDLLPDGRGGLKAARPGGTIDGFVGLLAGRTQKVASIEEINEAAAAAWAGKE